MRNLSIPILLAMALCVEVQAESVPKPRKADKAVAKEAKQHISYREYGSVYLMHMGDKGKYYVVEVNGERLSVTQRGQFAWAKFVPGTHEFVVREVDKKNPNDPTLQREFARFNLELSKGAVAFTTCGTKNFYYEDYRGARKLLPPESCANKKLSHVNGVGACASHLEYQKNPYPDACTVQDTAKYLGHDFDSAIIGRSQAHAEIAIVRPIDRRDEHYRVAQEADSIEGWSRFVKKYPSGEHVAQAKARLSTLRADAAESQIEKRIRARLEQDARLPMSVKRDKYTLMLTRHLERQEFSESLFYFRLLETLRVPQSPLFEYYWGEALLRSGQPKAALDKLYAYIETVGSDGQFYQQALELSIEAESKL